MSLFLDFLSCFGRNLYLLKQFSIREFEIKYKGTHLGFIWSLLLPLLLIATYTFVFGSVFKSKWQDNNESSFFFATVLFAGLVPFNFFSDVFISSSTIIHANSNLVKKVVFPLEILVISRLFSSLILSFISFLILLMFLILQDYASISWGYYPLIALPFILFTLGISLITASISVFIKDVSQILGVVVSLLMFLSPIFYKLDSMPVSVRRYFLLNPIAVMAEESRRILIFNMFPSSTGLMLMWAIGISTLLIGIIVFKKLKNSFADVL